MFDSGDPHKQEKSDIEYLSTLHACIRLVWIWPPKTHDSLYVYKAYTNLALLFYYTFGVFMYAIAVVRDPIAKYAEKIDATAMAMAIFTLMIEYTTSFYLKKKSYALFHELENFDNFGIPPNILSVNQNANRVAVFLYLYCMLASFASGLDPIFRISSCEQKVHSNLTLCGYATVLHYPYDISNGFLYRLHLVMQIYWFSMLCTGGVSFGCCCIAAIEFIISRIEHLKGLLTDLFKDGNPDRNKLRIYVRYHAYIMELVTKFNDCYRLATTPALFNYSAVLGLTMLTLFAEQNVKTILHPMGWLMAVLLFCYAGERLLQRSESVATLLYDLQWYSVDIPIQKDILFMLMRSQKALLFESGPLGEFSLATAKRIIQGAYTYKTLTSGLDEFKK